MAVTRQETLPADPDGATFVSSGLQSFRTSSDAFETAAEFENLAHSGTLRNPRVAKARAEELLSVAVALEQHEIRQ